LISKALDRKINGADLTRKLDKELDAQLGENVSERMQRGLITNTLIEMLIGLWEENPGKLSLLFEGWAERIRDKKS